MKISKTDIEGLYLIEPKIFKDSRGYFFESYSEKKLSENNIKIKFIQDNQSKSSYGVIRGLHYQLEPYAQTKLIRVLQGLILDVVIDIRKGSPTYGQVYSIELSDKNKKQLFIPKGFAHGFSVLSRTAVVYYKCDNFYNPDSERGILYNDPVLKIDWKIDKNDIKVSEKDLKNHIMSEAEINFTYK